MVTNTEKNADEKLAASISETLDKSLDTIDDISLQRLKNARKNALANSQKSSSQEFRSTTFLRKIATLRVAASLAVLMLIPIAVHQYSQVHINDQDAEIVSQDIPYSAEEMDDIDMLMSMEDSDA